MYRVVVVEDDRIIRRAIIKADWSQIGAEVVGEAADGQQALAVIEQTNPHLVITDINMPFMDGITFARRLREWNRTVRIIFVSGYDEFEYVREALLMKSDDYLLKPVKQEVLFEKAKVAFESWENEQQRADQLLATKPLLQEQVIQKLLYQPKELNQVDVQKELADLGIFLSGPSFQVFAFFIPDASTERPLSSYLEMFQKENEHEVLALKHQEAFILRSVDKDKQCEASILLEEMQRLLQKSTGKIVYATASQPYEELQELEVAIIEAKANMEVIRLESEDEAEDFSGTFMGNEAEIDRIERIRSFVELLHTQPLALEETKRLTVNMMMYVSTKLNQYASSQEHQVDRVQLSKELFQATSFEAIHRVIKPLLDRWEQEIASNPAYKKANSLVQQAIRYMKQHYHEPDLSLVTLANIIHVTSPYLSNLFKAETDRNFTEYLLEMRMEKAKELLRKTSLRTYEIAEQVGYVNPHYFSSSFKKYTGETPIEYRKSHV